MYDQSPRSAIPGASLYVHVQYKRFCCVGGAVPWKNEAFCSWPRSGLVSSLVAWFFISQKAATESEKWCDLCNVQYKTSTSTEILFCFVGDDVRYTFLGVSLVSFFLNIICRAEGGTGTYSYMYVTSDVTWTFPTPSLARPTNFKDSGPSNRAGYPKHV